MQIDDCLSSTVFCLSFAQHRLQQSAAFPSPDAAIRSFIPPASSKRPSRADRKARRRRRSAAAPASPFAMAVRAGRARTPPTPTGSRLQAPPHSSPAPCAPVPCLSTGRSPPRLRAHLTVLIAPRRPRPSAAGLARRGPRGLAPPRRPRAQPSGRHRLDSSAAARHEQEGEQGTRRRRERGREPEPRRAPAPAPLPWSSRPPRPPGIRGRRP
ncbi:hypothetical protein PVAP13_2NG118403 [Panicum virgatum]|uniref:Uncharacterized protein n=1 Tax=Panicum virgatum TaxID=38727 RepID=A0A8T0VI76_PANVG|nr:hypothetical protein PVAP13_2NG118403 [Panicum virgatum]